MDYRTAYESWLGDPAIDEGTKAELRGIAGNQKEIEDRFFRQLEFGTGGMRGVLGAGTNRLNIYTVRRAAQGLANYILKSDDYRPGMGVAIAHDCRRMSPEFCREAALVLCANGIKTYTWDSLRSTPELSFAVRHFGCISGIVITASHNPPEYNGFKVYWSDGGQCPYPRDEAIITEVNKITSFDMVKTTSLEKAKADGLFAAAGRETDDAFVESVKSQSVWPDACPNSDIKIVFTPLYGAGYVPVLRVLREKGFKNVYPETRQAGPDGNFPTVAYPNPEAREAFALSLETAERHGADIIIATDPDSDRVGVAARHGGEFFFLNGNMTGVLLADYIISGKKAAGKLPKNGAIVSTIVSTRLTEALAKAAGLAYFDVLTGFKYVGEKIKEFQAAGSHEFIFGFEESYGYLAGTHARDKDAVVASMLVCEAAAYYKEKGMTLVDALEAVYRVHGRFSEHVESITLKGVDGLNDIKRIMEGLRAAPPKELGGSKVAIIRDYKNSEMKCARTGKTKKIELPVSDVMHFTMEDETWACVRPSGTEPKIKLYYGAKLPAGASEKDAKAKLAKMSDDLKRHGMA